jgi:hypothetical protein
MAAAAVFLVLACTRHQAAQSALPTTTGPTAAAPTADALLALDRRANEAYLEGDSRFFDALLSDKFVMFEGGARLSKADAIEMIGGVKCEVNEGWGLTEPRVARIDNDTYALSYKTSMEGSCTANGMTEPLPSPVRAATVWVRSGDGWQAVFHGENLIVDPTSPPTDPPVAAGEPTRENDDEAANDAEPAAPAPGPSTDSMMAVERSVWEAWRAHDAKKLEDLTAEDITFVNIFGAYFSSKVATIEDWTSATCVVKSFALTDGFGTSVSPTVGILTLTGSVDGTCGGQDIGRREIDVTSVYVKEGEAWKWAFGFNSPS